MLRIGRVGRLAVLAALAGLTAVAIVVVDKLDQSADVGPRPDLSVVLPSLADEPPPPQAVTTGPLTPYAALVGDDVFTVHGWTTCVESARADVDADGERVSVRFHAYRVLPRPPMWPVECAVEWRPATAVVQLDQPLGDRRLVDAATGDPIPTLPAADLLLPTELSNGWEHESTAVRTGDGAVTEISTTYTRPHTERRLTVVQVPQPRGTPDPELLYIQSGTLDVNGHDAVWAGTPSFGAYSIVWRQDGYALRLAGHLELADLAAVAESVA